MNIVVVESHQHVLEHVHGELRKRLRKVRSSKNSHQLTMIHFDAHPDMACPGAHIPAMACFEPRRIWPSTSSKRTHSKNQQTDIISNDPNDGKNLYELLDSTAGGIAEWILPLSLGADLRKIYWIRSTWSDQFQDGNYSFHVGAVCNADNSDPSVFSTSGKSITSFTDLPEESTMKVDLAHRYYLDDNSVVPSTNLMLPKRVELTVSLVDQVSQVSNHPLQESSFSMNNTNSNSSHIKTKLHPSSRKRKHENLHDQNSQMGKTLDPFTRLWILDICLDYFACLNPFISELESISKDFTYALVKLVRRTRFQISDLDKDAKDIAAYLKSMKQLLQSFVSETSPTDTVQRIFSNDQTLINLFTPTSTGEDLIQNLHNNFLAYQSTNTMEASIKLIHFAIQALPNITMPHDQNSVNEPAALQKVKEMGCFIRQWKHGTNNHATKPLSFCRDDPFIITISRSTLDGFIPQSIVENVQHAVLFELHDIYCGCDLHHFKNPSIANQPNCRCKILFDYGDWEGSTFDD